MSERENNGKTNLADKLKELMKRPVEQLLLLMLAIQRLIGLLIGLPEIDVTSTIHEDKLSDYLGKVAKGINSRVRVDRTDEEKKEIKKAAQDAILLNKVYFQTFLDGQVGLAKEVLYAVTGKENIEISSMKTEVDLSRVGDGKDAVMDMVCKETGRCMTQKRKSKRRTHRWDERFAIRRFWVALLWKKVKRILRCLRYGSFLSAGMMC